MQQAPANRPSHDRSLSRRQRFFGARSALAEGWVMPSLWPRPALLAWTSIIRRQPVRKSAFAMPERLSCNSRRPAEELGQFAPISGLAVDGGQGRVWANWAPARHRPPVSSAGAGLLASGTVVAEPAVVGRPECLRPAKHHNRTAISSRACGAVSPGSKRQAILGLRHTFIVSA